MPSQNKQFWEVLPPGAWKGNRCFILGGGPSLKGFNFGLLKGEKVIAINRAFIDAPFADIMFTCDTRFYKKFRHELDQTKCMKVFLNEDGYPFDETVSLIKQFTGRGWSDNHRDGLYQGGHSGYGALELAASLGANPIYLLGYDFRVVNDQVNYHQDYAKHWEPPHFKEWIDDFEFPATQSKSKIVNLTPGSAIDTFPKMDIAELNLEAPFVVVSFFTVGTEYENDTLRLIESLEKFGIKYYCEGRPGQINNIADWRRNTYYKAEFIRRMMDKFPKSDIVWLDADAVVRKQPYLFNSLDCDIAVHYRNDSELLSGTMFLKNNMVTRNLLNLWKIKNDQVFATSTNQSEQRNLQDVLGNFQAIRVHRLPKEYTKIFDMMDGDPVIEHLQSSRRYR